MNFKEVSPELVIKLPYFINKSNSMAGAVQVKANMQKQLSESFAF